MVAWTAPEIRLEPSTLGPNYKALKYTIRRWL